MGSRVRVPSIPQEPRFRNESRLFVLGVGRCLVGVGYAITGVCIVSVRFCNNVRNEYV